MNGRLTQTSSTQISLPTISTPTKTVKIQKRSTMNKTTGTKKQRKVSTVNTMTPKMKKTQMMKRMIGLKIWLMLIVINRHLTSSLMKRIGGCSVDNNKMTLVMLSLRRQ